MSLSSGDAQELHISYFNIPQQPANYARKRFLLKVKSRREGGDTIICDLNVSKILHQASLEHFQVALHEGGRW